jgi:hypothetical protein
LRSSSWRMMVRSSMRSVRNNGSDRATNDRGDPDTNPDKPDERRIGMNPIVLYGFAIVYSLFYYLVANRFSQPPVIFWTFMVLSAIGIVMSIVVLRTVLREKRARIHLVLPIYYLIRMPLSMAVAIGGALSVGMWTTDQWIAPLLWNLDLFVLQYSIIIVEPLWAIAMIVLMRRTKEPVS